MKTRFVRFTLALAVIAAALVTSLAGCGSDDAPPFTPNPTAAEAEVDAGNTALANGDYALANSHFRAALNYDPSNAEANFGAAVTEVYILQNDTEVAGIIDYVQGQTRSVRAPVATSAKPRDGRSLVLGAIRGLQLDPEAGGRGVMGIFRMAADDPILLSDIQRAIKLKLMPRLQYAEARINQLESFEDLQIILTPEISGQPETIEIDSGDILMLDAMLNALQGWLGVIVAYDFDAADYDSADAESLLAPGTDFGALHPDGGLQLASARSNFLLVNNRLDAAVASISAETDDQSDDVLPSESLETPEFIQTMADMDQLDASLNGPVLVTIKDYQGVDFGLQIDIGKFFSNAISDLKTKLPEHTFVNSEPVPNDPLTFPDPTFNLIYPGMTNPLWRQLLGPITPALATRSR